MCLSSITPQIIHYDIIIQSAIGLNILTKGTFTEMDSIDITSTSYSFHQIRGEIWHCGGDIDIYSTELKMLRQISRGDMGEIRSVTNVANEGVAVAASEGVFIIQYSGSIGLNNVH